MNDSRSTLPQAFLTRLSNFVPLEFLEQTKKSFTQKRPTTFRVNTLKTSPEHLLTAFHSAQIVCEPISWNPIAFKVISPSLRELSETQMYKDGLFYVQSFSSMIPPLVLAPGAGDNVLDIAAAPGSKTTQMAALMENAGEILANDTSHVRRYRLEANLRMQGVTIARLGKDDGRAIWKLYPEYFDKVLVDAPCSMEGRFYTQEPKTYQDWSVKKIKTLSSLQRWMLRSAISATKPGGTIVYSTCTLSPEENEEVIDWIVKKESGNIRVEDFSIPKLDMSPALDQWNGKKFDAQVRLSKRVYPDSIMEGFFITKIKKIRSSIPTAFSD